jgi:hypothetical protein
LKRVLQRNIETKLAGALIIADVDEGSDLTFTVRDDDLAFEKKPAMATGLPQSSQHSGASRLSPASSAPTPS